MDNLKFIIFSIIILSLIGLAGFWAVSSIESGSEHVYNQDFNELKNKNESLEKQIASLERENDLLKTDKEAVLEENSSNSNKAEEPVVASNTFSVNTQASTDTVTYKYQSLINELQKLVDSNAYLKLKSQGAQVGIVQKFLNIYKPNSVKVDNDYGPTTVTLVKDYQKAQKLTTDGEVGVGTLKNMINWLKTKK